MNLQRHTINHQLHSEILSIRGHAGSAEGGFSRVVLAVPVDEVPHDFVQHGSPHGANAMHGVQLVHVGVGVRVGRQAGAVRITADALGAVVDPRAHGVVLCARVGGLEADRCRHEVAPSFAHAAGFERGQAVGVCGAAG
jgi:hypothetical protein